MAKIAKTKKHLENIRRKFNNVKDSLWIPLSLIVPGMVGIVLMMFFSEWKKILLPLSIVLLAIGAVVLLVSFIGPSVITQRLKDLRVESEAMERGGSASVDDRILISWFRLKSMDFRLCELQEKTDQCFWPAVLYIRCQHRDGEKKEEFLYALNNDSIIELNKIKYDDAHTVAFSAEILPDKRVRLYWCADKTTPKTLNEARAKGHTAEITRNSPYAFVAETTDGQKDHKEIICVFSLV